MLSTQIHLLKEAVQNHDYGLYRFIKKEIDFTTRHILTDEEFQDVIQSAVADCKKADLKWLKLREKKK